MSKANFKLYLPGLNELMKSAEMQSALEIAGQSVANIADGNYDTATHTLNYFSQVNVFPADRETAIKNAKNNELLKALGAAGLSMSKR